VFMLAILPQFIDPHQPLLAQYLIICVTMVAVDLTVMAGYTGLASRVLRLLRSPKQQRRMNRTFAGLFVGAAAFLATIHRGTA
jgi:homoserine/homoserine lactone efflux protein